jgi:hypothetical protein
LGRTAAGPSSCASGRFPSPLYLSLTPRAHMSELPPSSSRRRSRLSCLLPIESIPSIYSFLSWSTPGYLIQARAPLRSILLRKSQSPLPRGGRTRDAALATRHLKPRFALGLFSTPLWP